MKKVFQTVLIVFIVFNLNAQQLDAVYILSEGGFSSGTSALSKLSNDSGDFDQNIFNPGSIGLYPDGLIINEDNVYLSAQGSFGGAGKVYKLDLSGKVLHSQDIGTNPYSLAYSNDKIYLSNGPASSVSVVSASDLSKVTEIGVGVYPQEIISFDGKVFVANNSMWGGNSDSTITVIDSETDEVINTIFVKPDPSSLAITNHGNLLVGCPSGVIFEVELETFTKVDSFVISEFGFGKDICVDKNSDMIFFKSASNAIVSLDLSTRETKIAIEDDGILFTYGYGFDYISGKHYLSDAKDFSSNGVLNVYNDEGVLLNTYQTSVAPRRIVFQYGDNTVNVEDEIISANFRLDQNFPNPFNPSTIIQYSVPSNINNVKLTVFDILGNEIAILVDEQKSTGAYQVEFNAEQLASGIYYYKLEVDGISLINKMMLIK